MGLKREIKDFIRFDRILSVFFDEGFHYLIKNIGLNSRISFFKRFTKKFKPSSDDEPVRLKNALQKLGPTFIKFGQILSSRPDLLPENYRLELSKLQEHTSQISFEIISETIESELGPIKEIFKKIEKVPISTASISQVHKATLLNGDIVAVKVLKPRIKELLEEDIDILFFIAHIIEKSSSHLKNYSPVSIVKQFSNWTLNEVDLSIELENMERIRSNIGEEKIIIPKVYSNLTTNSVLVMEYLKGDNLMTYKFADDASAKEFAYKAINFATKMIFQDGFFHADPHPGNIYRGKGNNPLYFDFGMVGELNEGLRITILHLFNHLFNLEIDEALTKLLILTESKGDEHTFRREAHNLIKNWHGKPLNKVSLSRTIVAVLNSGTRNGFVFDSNIVLLAKTLVNLEGMVLFVYPSFRYDEIVNKKVGDIVRKEYSPEKLIKNTFHSLENIDFVNLPEKLVKMVDKIDNFDEVYNSQLINLEKRLYASNKKDSIAILFAAFIISSALFNSQPIYLFNISISKILLGLSLVTLSIYFHQN